MTVPKRRPPIAVAVAALLTLAACTASSPDEPATAAPTAELARFYEQTPDFGPCAGYAMTSSETEVLTSDDTFECARIDVPLDYDAPDDQTVRIALLRVPARGENPIGSLVLNTGGPGGSGLMGAATAATGLAESRITERFDLVGFDPRGVGASIPAVDCFTDAELDTGTVPTSTVGTAGSVTEADTTELFEGCAERTGGARVLEHLGTRDAARDMDLVRAVMGDEQLSYLGQSYGTRLGAVYAETFPDRVRAMVLDGAIDPEQGTFERRVYAYGGFQRSFEQLAAYCAEQPDCPLGPDPARATQVLQETLRPLLNQPVPAKDGFELTFDAATAGIISGLYSAQAWPAIIAGIAEVQAGRGDTLVAIGNLFAGRAPDGRWSNFGEAVFAINCMDEQRFTPEQTAELRNAVVEAAPFLDPGTDLSLGARDTCEAWPTPPTLTIPYAQHIEDLPPTLIVSITGDPSTPYEGGSTLAEALGGTMLTVEGEQHTIVMAGTSPCVDDIAATYLIDLHTPPADATCTLPST
ncbi:alpha/beta hydrolase [Nocardia mangyaensis]|uniref:Alpha/beta hydrolase n=1 Tax=Nocardia mangyaensis TaxID=2213200 RepID=A0A1J0VMB3_9NOCA|nr:alpha/beta hydrolase [Nocardia mangyaensis]APE33160.1 alpha/beta hydrolase [Nocardia mangyaensis]